MSKHPVPSIVKKLAWGAGIFFFLVLAIPFLLPRVVNTSALRHRILSQAAERVGGEVDFQALRLDMLPLPHAVVTQGRIERPGMFRIRFAKGVVYPRFWALLTGRVKISHLKIIEPDVVIPVSTDGLYSRQQTRDHSLEEIDQRIRRALTKAAGVPSPLAIWIEGGRLTLTHASQTSITFTEIRINAVVSDKGLALSVSGRSNLMETFELAGRIVPDSLDGNGRIQFTGLDIEHLVSLGLISPEVPLTVMRADLALRFETRGLESFHCQYKVQTPLLVISHGSRRLTVRDVLLRGEGRRTPEELRLTLVRLETAAPAAQLSATASWPKTNGYSWMPAEVTLKAVDLDVVPIRTAALELAGDQEAVRHLFDVIRGGRIPELDVRISGVGKRTRRSGAAVDIQGRLSQARIVLPHDLLRFEQVGGRVVMNKGRLMAEDVSGHLGDSVATGGTLVLGLFDGTRDFSLDAAIDANLSEVPAVLRKLVKSRSVVQLLDRIPPVTGRAAGRLRLGGSLDHITAKIKTNGRMEALDASLDISGDIYARPSASPDCSLIFKGILGPRMVAWLYDWGGISTDLMIRAPITVSRARMARNQGRGLDVEGRIALSDGLRVNAGLRIGPDEELLGKLNLQDSDSDAMVDFQRARTGGWQAGFAGKLEKSTVDRLLQHNTMILGWLRGDLRVRLQEEALLCNAVQGKLDFRQINTPPGFPFPLRFLNGQVAGKGADFDLSSVALQWEDSIVHLSGTGTLSAGTVNLELDLNADTLDADKLTQHVKEAKKTLGPRQTGGIGEFPICGSVKVHTGQTTFQGYRLAPFQAVATLEQDHVLVEVIDAGFCGISIPGQIRFDPDGIWMHLKPHAAGAALRDTEQCMAGSSITERLEGTVNVHGNIESRGQSGEELIHNLKGELDVQIADGRVYNVGAAGLFTNLLAFISVNQLIDGEMPDLRRNDFRYKSLTSKLSFREGKARIEEGVLKSNTVNIVANGDYGLTDKKMNLVLLVSPLTTVDWIIERIPLVGNILQGTLVAIPMGVKGPAADPSVVPLSPTAVGSRLGGILKRTLKTPFRILSPLLKDKPSKNQGK